MFRVFATLLIFLHFSSGLDCDSLPCVSGKCVADELNEGQFKCVCDQYWAGMKCDLPQPEVICGNKSIEIFIDKRIVTEQGLPGSPEFVHFLKAPGCKARLLRDGYLLKVDAPFSECGMMVTHNGGDYTYQQQIVWNRYVAEIERPLVLLDFKCTYQDKYIISSEENIPAVTSVDFETSYGTFKVEMNLFKNSGFSEEEKYGARPVVKVEDEVCVATVLKNVMPNDLVLTNRNCWVSTKRDGFGDTHYLLTDKCGDDPTTVMYSNGEGDSARFCFRMFKWKETMNEVYLHCLVNVCNVTAYPDYCQCLDTRTKRFARSISSEQDTTKISFGPIFPVNEDDLFTDYNNEIAEFDKSKYNKGNANAGDYSSDSDIKPTILIAVGVVLVIALIVLGVVVAVYINCRRKSRDQKSYLRSEGETVVIPNPTATMINDPAI